MINENKITITDIHAIIETYLNVLKYTEMYRNDNNMEKAYKSTQEIYKSIRKLTIASMLYNKKIICVSGLQGAGKTTLIKNFYNISDEYLNSTIGRGERIPIIITEKKDIKTPVMSSMKIIRTPNGDCTCKSEELPKEECLNAASGPDSETMYLELFVPYKHINSESISFMLLPGFEKKNDYWNTLIEFSINSSDAAVFVFNETSFSNADNEGYLTRIKNKFGDNLVYAISGSDGSSDGNAEVKNTCLEVLKIPENQSDRVVCVGAYNDDFKNQEWIKNLKTALDKYVLNEGQYYNRNIQYVYNELLNIQDNLYAILNEIDMNSKTELQEYENNALLKAFDKAYAKKKKFLTAKLNDQFDNAKSKSFQKIEVLSKNNNSILNGIKRAVFGNNVDEQFVKPRKLIEASLKNNDGSYLANEYLHSAIKDSLEILTTERTDLGRLIETEKTEGKKQLCEDSSKTKAVVADVCNLLADKSTALTKSTIQCENPRKLLSAVVEMATYQYGLTICSNLEKTIPNLTPYVPQEVNLNGNTIIEGGESSKNFTLGLVGLMGIDMVSDGSLNMITQLATAIGVSTGLASALSAGIIGIGAIASITKDLNKMQRADITSAKLTINSIYDGINKKILDEYDNCMEKVKDRIETNLFELGSNSKIILNEYNAKIEVNNALELISNIKNKFEDKTYAFNSMFS